MNSLNAPRARLNMSDAVMDVAPPHPPCFFKRQGWLEYLKSAAAVQAKREEPKVILIVNGEPKMNPLFPFCVDCTQIKSLEMSNKGKCNPNYLKEYYA